MVEIVAVCDIYDALVSPRPYRPVSYDNRSALEEIVTMAEQKQLRWKVVRALIALNRKSKPHPRNCLISLEKRGAPPPDNQYGMIAKE
jgi:HD-GYP domain-containing protein (c-di-GMP phosphodiesterase class II)